MAKKKREVPEINSSSTADIAFLLLIFFLITTSMDTDRGLARRLPPPVPKDQKNDTGKGPEVGRCKEEGTQRIASLLEHAGPVNVRE